MVQIAFFFVFIVLWGPESTSGWPPPARVTEAEHASEVDGSQSALGNFINSSSDYPISFAGS